MSVASVTIRKLLERVSKGEIRIPAFQREFIWEPDRVQFLMDSIYKGYPIGTLLLWRTKEQLQSDRDLGPYTLPDPEEQYPIDYVLDGQQRLTWACPEFCVNGPLAGNCRLVRRHNEYQETRRT